MTQHDKDFFYSLMQKDIESLRPNLASHFIKQLGKYAALCLKKEVFDKADEAWKRPRLPDGIGTAWVLMVLDDTKENSIIRPAFILPFRWKNNEKKHGHNLPESLKLLADRIITQLKASGWTLHLDMANIDFSSSESWATWESGWAPLYAGLDLAMDGYIPDPTVVSTGAWSFEENRLTTVDSIKEKAKVAVEFGAKHFFYPAYSDGFSELKDMYSSKEAPLKLHTLPRDTHKADDVIREEMRPRLMNDFVSNNPVDLEKFYVGITREKQQSFYLKRILPVLLKEICGDDKSMYHEHYGKTLVTWVSLGSELIDMGIHLFKPKNVILLFSGQKYLDDLERIKSGDFRGAGNPTIEHKEWNDNLHLKEIRQNIQAFFQERKDSNYLIDTTLGSVPMSLALYLEAPENATYLYWFKTMQGNTPQPFTTRPEFLPQDKKQLEM